MGQRVRRVTDPLEKAQLAARKGDYRKAEALAGAVSPGDLESLSRFRHHMETSEQAIRSEDWRTALRALADARIALADTHCAELQDVVHERLQQVMRISGKA